MKIIKPGKKPSMNNKKFECENCGCVFMADKFEYHGTAQLGVMDGLPPYECKCPTCGNYVYAN